MAKVGAQRAAELTGKSKSTIQRSMTSGKLSFELDNNGRRVIDVSELERVFGIQQSETQQENKNNSVERELEKASTMLEMEKMRMQIKMLEDKLEAAEMQIEDLKGQRDKWQKQADQVLITSQYSQKQAEEMREEIRMRDERVKKAKAAQRRKELEQQVKRLKPENENAEGFKVTDLWKKMRGAA